MIFKIGISGFAGSGKDSVCSILGKFFQRNGVEFQRIGLADKLKEDVKEALLDMYGIDPTNCPRDQKETIRSHLIFQGKQKRIESKGKYWTSIVQNTIENDENSVTNSKKLKIYCIPDIRYSEYEGDEVEWVKKGGALIYISRFSYLNDLADSKRYYSVDNKEEQSNDKRLQDGADYLLEWPDSPIGIPDYDKFCVDAVEYIGQSILMQLKSE